MRPLVYIAGASREWQRAQRLADRLHDLTGCKYEVPWWTTAASWTGTDARLTLEEQRDIAISDLRGIVRADIVWVLWPDTDGRSAVETEMGIALANEWEAPSPYCVIVSGARASESIFTALAAFRDASDEVAMLEVVKRLGGK